MKQKKKVSMQEVARTLHEQGANSGIPSDVLGSYTGHAMDGDRPIQDADDL